MPKPLSYQSSRFVLQNFEYFTRLQLAYRCPAIKLFEKSVPLRLECLEFENHRIILNDIFFLLSRQVSTRMRRRDRNGRYPPSVSIISYSVGIRQFNYRLITGYRTIADSRAHITVSREEALRKLISIVLGGRNVVYVKKMKVSSDFPKNLRWHDNFEVSAETLLAESHTFNFLLPIVSDLKPLEHLSVQFSNIESFNNDIVKSAETLTINQISTSLYTKLLVLRNKKIILKMTVPKEVVFSIVRNWKEEGRDIGFFLEMSCEENEVDIMKTLKNQLGGTYGDSREVNRDQLSIPMNTSSTIFIQRDGNAITLKAVSK